MTQQNDIEAGWQEREQQAATPFQELLQGPMKTTAVESIERAQVDIQISTAHRYPRNRDKCMSQAIAMATRNPKVAAACEYRLKVGGSTVPGPSVRLAEIIFSTWGNLRASAQVIDEGEKTVTARGTCHDLESNSAACRDVEASIWSTGKSGKQAGRFPQNIVVNIKNAAMAKAIRNAIFTVIPRAYIDEILEACRTVLRGNAKTMDEIRNSCLAYLSKMGVTPSRVCASVGATDTESLTLDHIDEIRALVQSIKDGEQTAADAFPELQDNGPGELAAKAATRPKRQPKDPVPPPEPAPAVDAKAPTPVSGEESVIPDDRPATAAAPKVMKSINDLYAELQVQALEHEIEAPAFDAAWKMILLARDWQGEVGRKRAAKETDKLQAYADAAAAGKLDWATGKIVS